VKVDDSAFQAYLESEKYEDDLWDRFTSNPEHYTVDLLDGSALGLLAEELQRDAQARDTNVWRIRAWFRFCQAVADMLEELCRGGGLSDAVRVRTREVLDSVVGPDVRTSWWNE